MPPVGYPSRGPWTFRNITRSFDFWPVLDSITISQEHPESLLTFSCQVEDRDAAFVFANEDICEATFEGERIAAFIISVPGEDQVSQTGPRLWDLTGEDFTSKLDDALVRRRTKRKREKVIRRIRWLLTWLKPNIWTLDGRDIDVPDAYIEAYEYYDMSVREALQQVADELRLHFYIDLDNVFHMFRTEVLAAPFDLDNENPDYVTTFPFDTWTRRPDSVELANAVHVTPEKKKHARWSRDAASITAYNRQERAIQDSNLGKPQQALNVGERTLAQVADPVEDITLRVLEPGLRAGMTIHVREKLWDHDFDRIIKSVSIHGVDPHDSEGDAYLFCDLKLSDRRPARARDGGGGSSNRNSRRRSGQTADPDPHVLDDFSTDVAAPTIVEGDSISASFFPTSVDKGLDNDEVTLEGPTVTDNPVLKLAGSTLSDPGEYDPPNTFHGWHEWEMWWKVEVPTHPGSMAGIRAEFRIWNPTGYASKNGIKFEVVASATKPTDTRQGVLVGTIVPNALYQPVDIPGALIPAASSDLYVGLRAGWQANYGESCSAWNWPWNSSASQLDDSGIEYLGRSGRGNAQVQAARWLTYSVTGGTLPDSPEQDDAPYEGGWSYHDAGTEGSPVYGVDDGALYLTSTSPAGKGYMQKGEYEDDDEPAAPWSDVRWGMEVTFDVDAAGLTDQDGERHIEVTTAGQGERTIGYVQLGDTFYASGIRVVGPSLDDFDAFTIDADTRYRALFDSRSGLYIRGKIWAASQRMPANINVEALLSETEDDLDRWVLWLRGGNVTGAQTVRVLRTRYFAAAQSGERVVRELVGRADGLTKRFYVAHPFRRGTLDFIVNGTTIRPARIDPDETWGELDFWPTPGSVIRATYEAD